MITDIIIIILILVVLREIHKIVKNQHAMVSNDREIHKDITDRIKKLKSSVDDVNGSRG
jgi:predicted Holliday junction resolvase-like endonuclease